jgi:hypothetical protein
LLAVSSEVYPGESILKGKALQHAPAKYLHILAHVTGVQSSNFPSQEPMKISMENTSNFRV